MKFRFHKILNAAFILIILLAACSSHHDVSEGVQLILSSDPIAPTTTFEIRFDDIAVRPDQVGHFAKESPLVIVPPLAGTFQWLSQRSGVFTPTEPAILGAPYRFTLRSGPPGAKLDRTVRTPPFEIADAHDARDRSDAPSEPEVRLQFNADVRAADARAWIEFRSPEGGRIPAYVRHATTSDYFGYRVPSARTWKQEFLAAAEKKASSALHRSSPAVGGTNPPLILNRLIVTPARPLPAATDWKMIVARGMTAAEPPLRLREPFEILIGSVCPFTVLGAEAHNGLQNHKGISLAFSKRLAPELSSNSLAGWISVSPVPPNFAVTPFWKGVELSGDFELNRRYTVTVRPGLPAAESFTLTETYTNTLTFEPLAPRIYFPSVSSDQLASGRREFGLLAVNVPHVRLRAKLLDRHTLIHALRGYEGYSRRHFSEPFDYLEPYQEVDFNVMAGKTIFQKQVPGSRQTDEARTVKLNWDEILDGRKTGPVFLVAEQPPVESHQRAKLGTQTIVQLTDLGLVWKQAQSNVTVYVFSYNNGTPVPRATVRVLTEDNESLAESLTDASGLVELPLPDGARWLMAEAGGDLHALRLDQHPVWFYRSDIPRAYNDEDRESRKVFTFTDRAVYRPGETVHLKALARDWRENAWSVPGSFKGALAFFNSKNEKILETNVAFSAFGSLDYSLALPPGPLGSYHVAFVTTNEAFRHYFSVQEFQPNAFEILLQTKPAYAPGEKLNLPLAAKYFFGKPLARAKVRWSLDASDNGFQPEGFDNFDFCTHHLPYPLGRNDSAFATQGDGTLTNQTNFFITTEIPINLTAPQPRSVELLVELTDLNQQTLSRSASFVQHSSAFYLGLKKLEDVVRAGQPIPLEVVAVRADGQPQPEPVKAIVTVQRIEWQTVRVQGAGRTAAYRSEPALSNVFTKQITTGRVRRIGEKWDFLSEENPSAHFVAAKAGAYLLEVRATDAAGHEVITAHQLQVWGEKELSWDYRNEAVVELVPDRKQYLSGDTAVILVKTPISGDALVTVERERVLRSFVTKLSGNAPSVRIPIEAGDAPNVFVSIMLLRGSADSPRQFKMPESRFGYCQLKVENKQTRLHVSVQPDRADYRPGDYVQVAAEITDAGGAPAPDTEVTLYAVDEGVLSLTGYTTPDPISFFFTPRPLAVKMNYSLPVLLPENPELLRFHNKGYLIGGGGADQRVRKNFLACAFWNATLRTDASGKVNVTFTAPDSLTRYRVIAVAHNPQGQFGSGEAGVQINKPLMVEPSLPRFANVTDKITARAVVHNQTAQPGEVEVTLQLDDKVKSEAASPLTRQIHLAAKSSGTIEIPLEFIEAGTAKWIWKARFLDAVANAKVVAASDAAPRHTFTDAVQSTLEVGYPAPLLREIYLARTEAEQTNLLFRANPQLLEGQGSVTVRIANTRLCELGEAISQLLHYPYGCVEQTSSSLLPWIVLRHAPAVAPLLGRSPEAMDKAIAAGVARLLSMQTAPGGLGYWPGDANPTLWASAYGGLVLELAKRGGGDVPPSKFDRLTRYLSEQLRVNVESQDHHGLSERCLALYTLALAGRAEPAYHEKMFERRESLSAESRALLALAITESGGSSDMMDELLRRAAKTKRAQDDWFGCDAREIAVRLLAWTRHRPSDAAVDVLAAELMQAQKDSHWGTTQGNAWGLFALTEYAARVEGALRPAAGTVTWGKESMSFQLGEKAAIFERKFATTAGLGSVPMLLTNSGKQRLYTQVKLEARPQVFQQPRQDRGFSIQRRYAKLDDDGEAHDLQGLRVGNRVLVTLTFDVREPAHYLAIDDALPSLFETLKPEFKSQQTRGGAALAEDWVSDFRELRTDRALFFRNHLEAGHYTIRYLARVRAAGTATAPAAKIEEMYHPDRFGLAESMSITSQPLE